ncbi:hypothetical protein SUGI_0331510 [Cryptomeria japonica]|uniref:WAT1-related protein At5g47470 n=1 Tax=Cryptomeria japonica TaxID=3369 RepID=UPI00240895A8|nr:WAT1-related protein At5g47470 [Cryptomeria japonica]GLJ18613.1 hypothetical protein SUGI_0331510 [Cryptomeria japonica]
MHCNGRSCMGLEDMSIYASMVGIQVSYGVISVLLENEKSKGRNLLPLAAAAYGLGGCILCPLAFFLDKEKRSKSKMSSTLLAQVLLISLTGVSAYQALLLMGLSETSPAFATAMANLSPAIIFVMAWVLGLEKVDIKSGHSQSKIVGTVICVMGAMVMSFITGPALMEDTRPSIPGSQISPVKAIFEFLQGSSVIRIRGCFYLLAAVMCFSFSMILQAKTLKKYPAPLSLTTMTTLLGSMEIVIYIIILDKGIHRESWVVDWGGLIIIIFGTLTCHGLAYALQYWCVKKRGPVFVAIFNPISTICSTTLAFFFLGDSMHVGSAIGIVMIFGGLYAVLWGKSKDNISDKQEQLNNAEIDEGSQVKEPLL